MRWGRLGVTPLSVEGWDGRSNGQVGLLMQVRLMLMLMMLMRVVVMVRVDVVMVGVMVVRINMHRVGRPSMRRAGGWIIRRHWPERPGAGCDRSAPRPTG